MRRRSNIEKQMKNHGIKFICDFLKITYEKSPTMMEKGRRLEDSRLMAEYGWNR